MAQVLPGIPLWPIPPDLARTVGIILPTTHPISAMHHSYPRQRQPVRPRYHLGRSMLHQWYASTRRSLCLSLAPQPGQLWACRYWAYERDIKMTMWPGVTPHPRAPVHIVRTKRLNITRLRDFCRVPWHTKPWIVHCAVVLPRAAHCCCFESRRNLEKCRRGEDGRAAGSSINNEHCVPGISRIQAPLKHNGARIPGTGLAALLTDGLVLASS